MIGNLIAHIRRFCPLSEADAEILRTRLHPIRVDKKELLLREGQVCRVNYFVVEGCLRLFFVNDKGVEKTTQFALEHWWIADYLSFEKQTPSEFFIESIEPCWLIPVDLATQEALAAEITAFGHYYRTVLQRAYGASQKRVKFMSELSREDAYFNFIKAYPEFVQRIPQYMLASFLGFTPEYLSELRKKSAGG